MGQKLRLAGISQRCAEPGFWEGKGFISSRNATFPCIYNESYEICRFVDLERYLSNLTTHPKETQPGPAKQRLAAPLRRSQTSLSQTATPPSTHLDRKRKRT